MKDKCPELVDLRQKLHLTYVYMSVEASGPHQSWIQDISSICAGQNHNVSATVESCNGNIQIAYKDGLKCRTGIDRKARTVKAMT